VLISAGLHLHQLRHSRLTHAAEDGASATGWWPVADNPVTSGR
jgi:hypothetical protein